MTTSVILLVVLLLSNIMKNIISLYAFCISLYTLHARHFILQYQPMHLIICISPICIYHLILCSIVYTYSSYHFVICNFILNISQQAFILCISIYASHYICKYHLILCISLYVILLFILYIPTDRQTISCKELLSQLKNHKLSSQ